MAARRKKCSSSVKSSKKATKTTKRKKRSTRKKKKARERHISRRGISDRIHRPHSPLESVFERAISKRLRSS